MTDEKKPAVVEDDEIETLDEDENTDDVEVEDDEDEDADVVTEDD